MAVTAFNYGKRPLGHGEGGGVGNAFQTLMCRIDWRDITAAATYNIFDVPAGTFFTRCYIAVETAVTSGGSATIQVQESTGSNQTLISSTDGSTTNLSIGSVISAPTGDGSDVLSNVAGHGDNFDTAARTVDLVVGTAALTAGVIVLVVEFVVIPQ